MMNAINITMLTATTVRQGHRLSELGGVEHGALLTSAADVALRRDMLRHMTS
jgi:hypothetical protein